MIMEGLNENQKQLPIFPIGVAAKVLDLSPSTLRMYESEGLLLPYKTTTNMRLFTQEDIEWVRFIRNLIKKKKLSVEGIRRILALIPCWKITECGDEKQNDCMAFKSSDKPCWTFKNGNSICENFECRTCAVYRNASQAFDTKKMLSTYTDY